MWRAKTQTWGMSRVLEFFSCGFMQKPENLFAIQQMFKNLVEVEYLVGFAESEHLVNNKRVSGKQLFPALL